MTFTKKIVIILALLLTNIFVSMGQNYIFPLKFKPYLSANFGELRNNHFHSGIDIKTQGVVGKLVYSIDNGFVSRISVSPSGYGLALYIDHPTGQTSVYGHLNSFTEKISKYVKEQQYKNESFKVNLYPPKDMFLVKKGDLIAYSGNSGSSGGAHLHFEIRDTKSEEPLDPMRYFKENFSDNKNPDINALAFYPLENQGYLNGNSTPLYLNIPKAKNGKLLPLKKIIKAWGKIGIGVKAYDKMNGTHNIYGVKEIKLFLDNKLIFRSYVDRFSFENSRMINSFIDFEKWRKSRSFFMKSYIEVGNLLPIFDRKNMFDKNGTVLIDSEKTYKFRYVLEDIFGNKTSYSFQIKGEKSRKIQANMQKNNMLYNRDNSYQSKDFSIIIPVRNLYRDIKFTHFSAQNSEFFSAIHQVNKTPVPLQNGATIKIGVTKSLKNIDTNRLGIVKIEERGKKSWIGGKYENGGMVANIRELGDRYAVDIDTISPTVVPFKQKNWQKSSTILLLVKDDFSGIKSFRGEIDGEFAIFENDIKSNIIRYKIDNTRVKSGKQHTITFTVTDNADNVEKYSTSLFW